MTLILGIVAIFEAVVIAVLIIHQAKSYAGEMQVVDTSEGTTFTLALEADPHILRNKDEVVFKVVRHGLNARGGNTD